MINSGTTETVGESGGVESGVERIQTPTQVPGSGSGGVSQLESVSATAAQSSSPSNSSNQSAGTGSAQSGASAGTGSAGAVGNGSGSPGPPSTQLTAQLQFSAPISAPNSAYANPLSYAAYNPQTIRNAPY